MAVADPTHRFIRVDLTHTGESEDFHYIDIARELSAINSRLYRQGMLYHVANISLHDTQASYIKVCTVPNTWPAHKAWQRGLEEWMNMNYDAMDSESETIAKTARWADFRTYFSADHISDPDICTFTDVEGNEIRRGEWNYSRFYSTDGGSVDEFTTHMMGLHTGGPGSYTSVGLIQAYNEVVTPPTVPTESASYTEGVWANLDEVHGGSDDVLDALTDDYDAAPYDAYCFPGSSVGVIKNSPNGWSVREVHIESANNSAMLGGFECPLGLIKIETDNSEDDNVSGLIIEIAPGPYKGVAAESMGTPVLNNEKVWEVE